MGIQQFAINIPQAGLDDLAERPAAIRWPGEIPGAGWDYGANLSCLRELVECWQTGYDWRAQERALNRFGHFRASVNGLGVYFIHARGRGADPLPLIISHGWPGLGSVGNPEIPSPPGLGRESFLTESLRHSCREGTGYRVVSASLLRPLPNTTSGNVYVRKRTQYLAQFCVVDVKSDPNQISQAVYLAELFSSRAPSAIIPPVVGYHHRVPLCLHVILASYFRVM